MMERTIKDPTVKPVHHDSQNQLKAHLTDVMAARNFGRSLETLGGLGPCGYICKIQTSEPDRFIPNPIQHERGVNAQTGPYSGGTGTGHVNM